MKDSWENALPICVFRQHSLSLAEALALCISVVFCTQIHNIVCMSSNHHQVAFFLCIRCCQQALLITLHLGAYCGLYFQETGSVRATRCWLWFCTRYHKPFLASWCFCNGGVHVTFHLTLPPQILFSTKDTLRVSCRSPSRFEVPRCYLPNSSDFRVVD